VTDQDPLDDAIDRAVRDMTHVAADDDGVARVMARLREARARDDRRPWIAPRVAWAGAAALLLVAIAAVYSLRSRGGDTDVRPITVAVLPQRPLAIENPTPAVSPPSTMHATTARITRGRVVKPTSVAASAVDASERRARNVEPELPPLESDIVIASITPAPLGEAPAIYVEPLITPSLQVDAIPLPSIDLPPVSPERQ
jgi:hypothetical protein